MYQKMKQTPVPFTIITTVKKKKKSERTLQFLTNTSENNQTHSCPKRYWIVKQST